MWERQYLLKLGVLLGDSADKDCERQLEALLDQERLLKYHRKQSETGRLQSLGAGVLLQIAVMDYMNRTPQDGGELQFRCLEVENLLMEYSPDKKIDIQYEIQPGGKPSFLGIPLYFSLSHSGEMVFLAVSEKPVGADLQKATNAEVQKLADRFFAGEEARQLAECGTPAEASALFFRMWARKEAYGKLTGRGVAPFLGKEICKEELIWAEQCVEYKGCQYYLAVCVREEAKE